MAEKEEQDKSVAPAPIEALGIAQGLPMNLPFSSPFYHEKMRGKSADENLQELFNDENEENGPTVSQLVAMRRMDGQARALYRLLTRPILAALKGATIRPAEGGEKEAKFVEQALFLAPANGGMTIPFNRVMAQLLQALFDGFSAFEKVYHRPKTGPLKGKTTLKKILYLPVQTVTFITDKGGGFRGLRQRAYYAGETRDIYIEPQYAFYYAAQEEERPFYGVSYFQSAFYHYDKKMKSYFLAHLAAQRSAVGTRVGTVPVNATDQAKKEFHSALGNLAFAQFMAFPEGFKVEILREGSSFDFLNYINHHNSQMSKSILAAFFDESQGSGSNDNAMIGGSGPGDEWFTLQFQAIQEEIAAAINNYIIPDLVDQNFRGGRYPTFVWGTLSSEQKKSVAQIFERLSTSGQSTNVTPEFMRELEKSQSADLGFNIDYDDIAKREKEDADRLREAGIDPKTGAPFPVPLDPATGQPAGQANPDQLASTFEQQALSLSREQSEALFRAADDLLTRASTLLPEEDYGNAV